MRLVRLQPYSSATIAERSQERYRRVTLTTLASLVAHAASTLTTLAAVPLALGYLGTERYGLWMSVTSLVAVVAAADLGIGNGLLNAIAESHGKDDKSMAGRYASSAFFLLTAIALALAAVVVLVEPLVSWGDLLKVSSATALLEAPPTVLILLGCSFLSIPIGIAARIHLGYQEGYVNGLWQGLGSVLGLVGMATAIILGASMPWVVLGFAVGPVISGLCNLLILVGRRAWLRPRWSAMRSEVVARLLKTGLMFALLQAVVAAAFMSDNFIVAWLFGADVVAQYAVHAQLFAFAPLLAGMALSPLWPAYGEAIARGDSGWVRGVLVRSVALTFAVVSAISLVLVASGQTLIHLWVGSRVEPLVPLMIALAAWAVLSSAGTAVAMFLNGAGVLRLQAFLACAMGVAAVLGKVGFGLLFGLPGVVWGTVTAYSLFMAIPLAVLLPRIVARIGARP
jgi:O-antigen/teichoic acid export membrane protein